MIIVVEGIDRVGKTTLVKKLSEAVSFPVFKHNASVFDYSKMDNANETDKMIQMLEVIQLLNENCSEGGNSIIFDRFHMSDYVYGVIGRGYDQKTAYVNFSAIDNMLTCSNAILIMVNPTDIVRSSMEHGKDLSLHHELFTMLFDVSKVKCKLSTDFCHLDEAVKDIEKIVKGEQV